jgi:N12 class adenine-specific DNA methylase
MLMRTRWLMQQNSCRGVVFVTGTPASNMMAELYTMQRCLQPEELKEGGLAPFD